MKHHELKEELASYLSLMDLGFDDGELELLVKHVELVLEANTKVNLTRVVDPSAALRLHTADSLAVLGDLSTAHEGEVLDLGSGAGFPGIPLAICSGRHTTLLDSVAKKVRELDRIVGELALPQRITAMSSRAEMLARTRPEAFAVVTARAVSELPALVELASPLLKRGGRLICLKGSPSDQERSRSNEVAAIVGMVLEYERQFDLPEGVGHRTVLCFRKAAASRVTLPRREGLAQHSPLA